MENPFSISFGKAPTQTVNREGELAPIMNAFDSYNPTSNAYIISGPRGSGKTVAFSYLLEQYHNKQDWVVARLNMAGNMLEQLAGRLYEGGKIKHLFLKAEFNFSFQGIGLSIAGSNPVPSILGFLQHVFEYLKHKKIHVIIGIDDVAKNKEMVEFIRAFQGFLMDGFDVRLLMTGLYENVSTLSEEPTLTFLIRTPKVILSPLPLLSIAKSYQKIFAIDEKEASSLARATKGYAYAYQLLGNILFSQSKTKIDDEVLSSFDEALQSGVYNIIWRELSEREREILTLLSENKVHNSEIQETLSISKGNLAIYKKRLSEKGLIDTTLRGVSSIALPRFDVFILDMKRYFGE